MRVGGPLLDNVNYLDRTVSGRDLLERHRSLQFDPRFSRFRVIARRRSPLLTYPATVNLPSCARGGQTNRLTSLRRRNTLVLPAPGVPSRRRPSRWTAAFLMRTRPATQAASGGAESPDSAGARWLSCAEKSRSENVSRHRYPSSAAP